jgi:hypothetical protein
MLRRDERNPATPIGGEEAAHYARSKHALEGCSIRRRTWSSAWARDLEDVLLDRLVGNP